MQGVVMIPSMDTTISNIKCLSPSSYQKAAEYIEKLLSVDAIPSTISEVSDSVFESQVDVLFNEYNEAFSVLAK